MKKNTLSTEDKRMELSIIIREITNHTMTIMQIKTSKRKRLLIKPRKLHKRKRQRNSQNMKRKTPSHQRLKRKLKRKPRLLRLKLRNLNQSHKRKR
jgi:hypothetical protein